MFNYCTYFSQNSQSISYYRQVEVNSTCLTKTAR